MTKKELIEELQRNVRKLTNRTEDLESDVKNLLEQKPKNGKGNKIIIKRKLEGAEKETYVDANKLRK